MSKYLTRRIKTLAPDESGQMAFLMLLVMPVVFIFFSLTLDAGVWYFDHRMAQNQADAAALAAAQHLPAPFDELGPATDAVELWLTKNGADPDGDLDCLVYSDDLLSDGLVDTVRVCVGRDSPGIFSTLVGVKFVHVSAAAKAQVGWATITNVMPWAIAPDDPKCDDEGDLCRADMDGNGDVEIDEYCGYFSQDPDNDPKYGDKLCPWGLHEDRLYRFKVADKYTAGNFGAIQACGSGGGNTYEECITGAATSEFYSVGGEVWVDVQTGNLTGPTNGGINDLYANELTTDTRLQVYKNKTERALECDVPSKPHPITGMDAAGKEAAKAKWVDYPCDKRLVSIVIIDHFPDGGGLVEVLGVATFGIASWDRTPEFGDAMGNETTGQICGQAFPVNDGGKGGYQCGQVWGYFMHDAYPAQALLGGISASNNPFAPQFIALTD